jgi:hypothetical protein
MKNPPNFPSRGLKKNIYANPITIPGNAIGIIERKYAAERTGLKALILSITYALKKVSIVPNRAV